MEVSSSLILNIFNRLTFFYISNEDVTPLLLAENYHIQLENYILFSYGQTLDSDGKKVRSIQIFQFVAESESGGYFIKQYFLPTDLTPEKIYLQSSDIIWVPDWHYIRTNIFHFIDKTSLFRSTFLFHSDLNSIFRLHKLLNFLSLRFIYDIEGKESRKSLVKIEKKKQFLLKLEKQIDTIRKSLEIENGFVG